MTKTFSTAGACIAVLCSIICSLWHLIIVTSCFWVLSKTADSPQLLKSDHSVLPFVSDLFSNLCLTFPGTECLLCFRSRQKTSLKPFVSAGRLCLPIFPYANACGSWKGLRHVCEMWCPITETFLTSLLLRPDTLNTRTLLWKISSSEEQGLLVNATYLFYLVVPECMKLNIISFHFERAAKSLGSYFYTYTTCQ